MSSKEDRPCVVGPIIGDHSVSVNDHRERPESYSMRVISQSDSSEKPGPRQPYVLKDGNYYTVVLDGGWYYSTRFEDGSARDDGGYHHPPFTDLSGVAIAPAVNVPDAPKSGTKIESQPSGTKAYQLSSGYENNLSAGIPLKANWQIEAGKPATTYEGTQGSAHETQDPYGKAPWGGMRIVETLDSERKEFLTWDYINNGLKVDGVDDVLECAKGLDAFGPPSRQEKGYFVVGCFPEAKTSATKFKIGELCTTDRGELCRVMAVNQYVNIAVLSFKDNRYVEVERRWVAESSLQRADPALVVQEFIHQTAMETKPKPPAEKPKAFDPFKGYVVTKSCPLPEVNSRPAFGSCLATDLLPQSHQVSPSWVLASSKTLDKKE